MRRAMWIIAACGSAALAVGGCGRGNVRSDEAMLGHVPMERKQAVFTAQNNVSVAEANVASAQRARDEAQSFKEVADRELDAAKARLDASRKAAQLNRQIENQTGESADTSLSVAQRQVEAFTAKRDFASRLVDLRDSELNAARKRWDIAKDDFALTRATTIERAGMRPTEKIDSLRSDRDGKIADLAGLDKRTQLLREEVSERRTAWNERRRAYNVASRSLPPAPAAPAPPPAQKLQPEPLPAQPQP